MNPSDTLPLFPLQAVLFPGGLLALKVFEPRYLHLVARCLREHSPFGVVCLTQGSEVRQPGAEPPRFELIGTVAHITAAEVPHGEPVQLRCRGGQRFRLGAHAQQAHGLWAGQATLLPDDPPVPVPDELASLAPRLQDALRALGEDLPAAIVRATDPRWQDAGWLANRWSELLPIPAEARQRLMTLDNPVWRLELVSEWLERLGRQADAAR